MPRYLFPLLSICLLAGCTDQAAPTPDTVMSTPDDPIYRNARFGFEVTVPDDFVGLGESDNGDGQIFVSRSNDAEIRASGGHRMEPEIACTAGRGHESARITYSQEIGNTSVASGIEGERIFYTKVIRTHDRCLTLLVTYPEASKKMYDDIVRETAASFIDAS